MIHTSHAVRSLHGLVDASSPLFPEPLNLIRSFHPGAIPRHFIQLPHLGSEALGADPIRGEQHVAVVVAPFGVIPLRRVWEMNLGIHRDPIPIHHHLCEFQNQTSPLVLGEFMG